MAWEIIWSETAEQDLNDILEYWIEHNKSNSYSIKLAQIFLKATRLLIKMPYSGVATDSNNIRCIFRENYSMFYEILESKIIIHRIWDNRRNPEHIEIK
jgi:plasmid stabilization system protein ParE